MKDIIKFKVNAYKDREAILVALANSGYKVWIQEEEGDYPEGKQFYVCMEK